MAWLSPVPKWSIFLFSLFLQQQLAQQVLTEFKENSDAWTKVDTILEFSSNQETKVCITICSLVFLCCWPWSTSALLFRTLIGWSFRSGEHLHPFVQDLARLVFCSGEHLNPFVQDLARLVLSFRGAPQPFRSEP